MNAWTLALLDSSERLHLVDVHTHEEQETSDLSSVGLVYESSHFKGIFTGGNVSKAMVSETLQMIVWNSELFFKFLLLVGNNITMLIILSHWFSEFWDFSLFSYQKIIQKYTYLNCFVYSLL